MAEHDINWEHLWNNKENERSTIGHTTLIFQNTSNRDPIKVLKCFQSKKEKNK